MESLENEKSALDIQFKDIDATLQLLREGIDVLEQRKRRKRAAAGMKDQELALLCTREELENRQTYIINAISAHKVNYSDKLVVSGRKLRSSKNSAKKATHGDDQGVTPLAKASSSKTLEFNFGGFSEETRNLYSNLMNSSLSFETGEEASAHNKATTKKTPKNDEKRCTACFDDLVTSSFKGSCGHEFCRDCMRRMFQAALKDDHLFPPRCCDKVVKPRSLLRFLNLNEIKKYDEKILEYETKDKLYCGDPKCSKFIPPSAIRDEHGTCKSCKKKTHVLCRSLAHVRDDCPEDKALQRVLKIAKKNRWKRCTNCRTMVSLNGGCSHISCR